MLRDILHKQVIELTLGHLRAARNNSSFSWILEQRDVEFKSIILFAIHLHIKTKLDQEKGEFAYLLASLGCLVRISELHVAEAAGGVVLIDRAPCTHNLTELRKGIVEVLVSPLPPKALDKDVAVLLRRPMHVLVERECATHFAVKLWELYSFSELAGIEVVGKPCVRIVKVLQLRSVKSLRMRETYLLRTSSHSPATLRMYSYSSTIETSFGRSPM